MEEMGWFGKRGWGGKGASIQDSEGAAAGRGRPGSNMDPYD